MLFCNLLQTCNPMKRKTCTEGSDAAQGRVRREDGSAAPGLGARARMAQVERRAGCDKKLGAIPAASRGCAGRAPGGATRFRAAEEVRRRAVERARRRPGSRLERPHRLRAGRLRAIPLSFGSVLGLLRERGRAVHLHLDLLRLRLGLLGERDPEYPVAAFGAGVLRVYRRRHREGAAERTVAPLDAVVRVALVRIFQAALPAQSERVALDLDVHVPCVHLGQLHFERARLGALEDVHLRRPTPGDGLRGIDGAAAETVRLVEGTEDAVLQLQELTERIVTHDGHDGLPCRSRADCVRKDSRVLSQEPSSDANHVRRFDSGRRWACFDSSGGAGPTLVYLGIQMPLSRALAHWRAHTPQAPSKPVRITERKAVFPTIAILVVGCFVISVAVLVLASVTDGRREATMMARGASGRRAHRLGRWS